MGCWSNSQAEVLGIWTLCFLGFVGFARAGQLLYNWFGIFYYGR